MKKLSGKAKWITILNQQRHPVRFLFSRILRDSGLWRLVRIRRNGYQLKLHPASLALSLWVDKNDRKNDSLILKKLLRKDDHFYDVGANIGHLCIEGALAVGPNGVVTAFEAHPRIARFLSENITLNKLTNIRLVQVAVGHECGYLHFSDYKSSDDQNQVTVDGVLTVPSLTLDTLYKGESIELVKIDVEGFELFVLLGGSEVLSNTQFIYFEASEEHFRKFDYGFSDIFRLLSQHGFHIGRLVNDGIKCLDEGAMITETENLLAWRDSDLLIAKTGWRIIS